MRFTSIGFSKDRYQIRIGILIAAVFQLIIWLFTKRKSFVREMGRMPFLMNHQLNNTVKKYLETDPSNQVLLISGPYQSGKSRILELVAESLIKTKRFPFIMRVDQSVTVEDLVDSIKINCLKTIRELSKYMNPIEIQKFGALSLSQKVDHPQFGDIGLSKAYDYMEFVANSLIDDPFIFFDHIKRIEQVIKPCVLIFGFDQLIGMKKSNSLKGSTTKLGSTIFNISLQYFKKRTQFSEQIPYILEISNSMIFLNNKRKSFLDDTFIYGFTDEIEDINEKVVKRSLFTYKETQYLIENFGGHGGSYSYVFDEMQIKRPMKVSADTLIQKLNILLGRTIKNVTSPVWYQICQSKGEIPWREVAANRQLLFPLIKQGLLYTNVSKVIKTAHPGVLRYICEVAKKPRRMPAALPPKRKKEAPKKIRDFTAYEQQNNETLHSPLNSDTFEDFFSTNELVNKTNINQTNVNKTNINQTNVNQTNINQTFVNQTFVNQTNVNQTNVNQTNVNQTNVNQTNVNQTNVNQTNINETTINEKIVNETAINEKNNSNAKNIQNPSLLNTDNNQTGAAATPGDETKDANVEIEADNETNVESKETKGNK